MKWKPKNKSWKPSSEHCCCHGNNKKDGGRQQGEFIWLLLTCRVVDVLRSLEFSKACALHAAAPWSFVNMWSHPERRRRTEVEVVLLEFHFCKILFTDECAGREKEPRNSIWTFLFLQTVAGCALRASVTVSSHIQILVLRLKATKTLLSVCGAASSDRNINPPIPPSSSSSKPLKRGALYDEEWLKHSSTLLITDETAPCDTNIHLYRPEKSKVDMADSEQNLVCNWCKLVRMSRFLPCNCYSNKDSK